MVKEHISKFRKEFKKHSFVAITAAFSFLIALFWRDAIQAYIDDLVKTLTLSNPYIAKIIAAIIVTIIAVIGIMILAKFEDPKEEKD